MTVDQSAQSTQSTKRKKVISFSLWGDNPLYVNGAIANAEMREEFYPDWVCRFYYGDVQNNDGSIVKVDKKILDRLRELGCEVINMGLTSDVLGMYWRFHPMFDDAEIERFLVRDTDSKFSKREVAMVNEWIESDYPFHIIRDNPSHNVPILGGTWGAVPQCVANFKTKLSMWFSSLRPCTKNPRGLFHGTDQIFLYAAVWPTIHNNHLAHVLADCKGLHFTGKEREVAAPQDNHYVGMVC